MTDAVDAVVIGAGVVGLAVARALAREGLETVLLERADAIGTATSSRNSEVVHAGIYYPTGSWKARLCARGRELLYAYLESHAVAHRRCGKLIVATSEAQRGRLAQIAVQGLQNGVEDLQALDDAEARRMEPALAAVAALWSPSTGIVDSHGLMLALRGDFESAGGALALRSPVLDVAPGRPWHRLTVGGDSPSEIDAGLVVNAAGLWAPQLASRSRAIAATPTPRHAKGSYFALAGRAPFTRLVYPVPEDGGLGVHLTLDLTGQARFGPDVEWLDGTDPDAIDYRVDPRRADGFESAIRRYWPALPDGVLQPDYSGVRPKLVGSDDFLLQGPAEHGVDGLLHLYGIESPGLTACLAIAEEAVSRLLPRPAAPASGR